MNGLRTFTVNIKKPEVCLCIVYNHNYEKNIDKIEKLYKGRFKNIYHLMPFYRGDIPNVISVWENSYRFSGFFAQGLHRFYNHKYSHYIFAGDDVMLDPAINEKTILGKLLLDNNCGFIARNIYSINERHLAAKWWIFPSFLNYLYSANGAQFKHLIPDISTAVECSKKHGLKPVLFSKEEIQHVEKFLKKRQHFFKYRMKHGELTILDLLEKYVPSQKSAPTEYVYPFVAGFSDFFVIPGNKIKDFAYYAGIFAAAGIFVEMAVPTSMVLTLDKIVQPKDIQKAVVNFTTTNICRGSIVKDHNASVREYHEHWPDCTLLVHPVKLSEWNVDV